MQTNKLTAQSKPLIALLALLTLGIGAQAGPTQLTNSPLSGASSADISPNILFVLDDSGSMDWDYLPDWAGDGNPPLFMSKNSSFNGVAYNPAVYYQPPKYFNDDGTANTTTYLSQTSANTGAWGAVKNDGYGIQSTTTSPLPGNALYFTTVAGEYCTTNSLKVCIAASAPDATYPIAAKLRWCTSAAEAVAAVPSAGACQATQIEPVAGNTPYNYPRMPSPRTSTITISGSASTSISIITVDTKQILSVAISATTNPTTMASDIESSINACTFGVTGLCEAVGYSAVASGSTLTISAPGATGSAPTITKSGSMTVTPTAFARPATNLAPGENLLTVITSTITPAPNYPKTAKRTDCAADPCSFTEEMTNFANWWAYYRTRMQTMKTATSLSFEPINFKKRIGYSTINNNTGSDFQNIASFELTQKKAWYDKVFSAIPSQNTPLRIALSKAGRLYAGKFNGLTFNGVDVIDPVQHYCQQNVTILSTDGYWNEGAGFQMDGTSAVGDQDGPGLEVRPQLDGGAPQDQISTLRNTKTLTPTTATWLQKKTEQLQHRTKSLETRTKDQLQARTSRLQSKTGQWQSKDWKLQSRTFTQGQISTLTRIQQQTNELQMRTGPLQNRTANLQTRTFTQIQERTSQLQSKSGQRQSKTYQLQQRVTQVQQRSSGNGGTSWGSWTNVASCVPDPSGTDRVQCQTLGLSGWNNVASCSVIAGGTTVSNAGTDLEYTTYTTGSECQYTTPSWVDVGSCSPVAKSAASPYTVGTAVDCQTVWATTWSNAGSCDVSATLQCRYAAWTGYSNVGSCAAQPKSPGPTNYSVGVARECTTDWTAWADTGSTCTSSATVGCQYGGWSGYTNDGTCAAVTGSTGNPWNVLQKKECAVNYGAWQANQTACTPVTTGATQTQCQYIGWSGWSDVGSCSTTPLTGPPFAGPGRNCQTLWTTPVNTAVCVPDANTNCTTTWTAWADVPDPGTCTYSAGATECQYRLAADWYNTASCTANPRSSSPNYTVNQATDCQMTWPSGWVDAVATCTVAVDKQCQYTAWTGWVAGACTAAPQTGASPFTTLVAKECQTDWTGWSAAGATCSFLANTRECRYTGWSGWSNVASATSTPESSGPDYVPAEEQQTVITSSPEWGPAVPASTTADPPPTLSGIACTAGTVAGLTTSCRNVIPNPSLEIPVPSCTPEAADATNGWIERTCNAIATGPNDVASCTGSAATALNSYTTTTCTVIESGPTPDTLADVAQYYWKTDLRDPLLSPDRCTGGPVVTGGITTTNNVCTNDLTNFTRQFMSTYTLGLGASGLMQYQSDYLTASSGDFSSVKDGTAANLVTGVCSWQKNGVCNWPKPASNSQTNIDDLWHAAVNGRGTYFSAGNPDALAAGISSALAGIDAKGGSLTAVTVTSPNLVAGDSAENAVFEISFKSTEWTGDLVKRTINGDTGALSADSVWPSALAAVKKSAKELLEEKVVSGTHTARTIYTFNPGGESASSAADSLKFFLWANLSSAQQDFFLKPNINSLSQFCASGTICLDSTIQDDVAHTKASGENLLKFVRGDKSHEGTLADLSAYYRSRTNLLGDIVGSEAVYVKGSPWNYADYGYAAFKAANTSTRQAMVYVGANDGMLHAFNSDNGEEEWAYVPTMVMPNLYTLADKNYPAPGFHRFFVDGTPVMGDICTSNCVAPAVGPVWKTILVGGLNNGGRGYYALDITDPAAPKALWEFTDANLGYSYGNPVITKLKNGTWVVIMSSGYNNSSPGDGEGRLFILNANTGVLIRSISTGVGDTTTPSGLSRITAWANFPDNNNTAQRVYGGDLLGNLWRFDVNGDIPAPSDPPVAADYDAQRLATLKDANGDAQPITSKPELGKIKNYPVVFVGTGQLLGGDDLATTQRQSLYAIKDKLTNTDYGSPRPLLPIVATNFVAQTLTSGICAAGNTFCAEDQAIVTSTNNTVDFTTKDGWYTDFPVAGERVNTDLRLQLGTLAFNTNTPKSGACVPVGVGYAYFLDYRTGGYVEGTNGLVGIKIGDFLVTSPSVIRLSNGTIKELIRTDAPGTTTLPVPTAPSPFDTRRISWRELVTE